MGKFMPEWSHKCRTMLTWKKARPARPRVAEIFEDCKRIYQIFMKYISIYSLNELINAKRIKLEKQNGIKRLISIWIAAIGQYFRTFLPQTNVEILYDWRSGRGNKIRFSMSGWKQTWKNARHARPRVAEIFEDCGRIYQICKNISISFLKSTYKCKKN